MALRSVLSGAVLALPFLVQCICGFVCLLVSYIYLFVCAYTHVYQEDKLWELILPFYHVDSKDELRLSGLAASTLTL